MKHISIDLETRSSVDINKCGVYRYVQDKDFSILLFAYSVDGGEVNVIDLSNGENIPPEILNALTDEKSLFVSLFKPLFKSRLVAMYYGLVCVYGTSALTC